MGFFNFLKPPLQQAVAPQIVSAIKRDVEILQDCQRLVNDSSSLEVVLSRYETLLQVLQRLIACSPDELSAAGISFPQSLSQTYHTIISKRDVILNQAIQRAYDKALVNACRLKTQKAFNRRLAAFFADAEQQSGLSRENLNFLGSLKLDFVAMPEMKWDGDSVTVVMPLCLNIPDRYLELAQEIDKEKNTDRKIDLCNQALKLLPDVVESELGAFENLSLCIACRDWLPELYMRRGNWREAERVIKFCMEYNAYYPENGNDELLNLADYMKTAEIAVAFLKKNPGFLQKNIYKALGDTVPDVDTLKHFIRCSEQIRKEPEGKTYRLYVSE